MKFENLTIDNLETKDIKNNFYSYRKFHEYLINRDDINSYKIIIDNNKSIKIYTKNYKFFFKWKYGFIYDLDIDIYDYICSNYEIYSSFLKIIKSLNIDLFSGIYTNYNKMNIVLPTKNYFNLRPWQTQIISTSISESIENLSGSRKRNIKKNINQNHFKIEIPNNMRTIKNFKNEVKNKKKIAPIISPYIYNNHSKLFEYGISIYTLSDKLLSQAGFIFNNELAVINTEITTQLDKIDKYNSHEYLIWIALSNLEKKKVKYLDLAGFTNNPINNKEVGIMNYKNRWPGDSYYYFYGDVLELSQKAKILKKILKIKKIFF